MMKDYLKDLTPVMYAIDPRPILRSTGALDEIRKLRAIAEAAEKMIIHCDKWLIKGVSTQKEELRQALAELEGE